MTDPNVAIQAAPDSRKKTYDALSVDPKYQKSVPSTFEEFLAGMENPETANKVFSALSKDKRYSKALPEASVWTDTFKKKVDTEAPGIVSGPSSGILSGTDQVPTGPPEAPDPAKLEVADPITDIRTDLEQKLETQQKQASDNIFEDVQAKIDAQELTLEEGQAELTRRFQEEGERLFQDISAEFDVKQDSVLQTQVGAQAKLDASTNKENSAIRSLALGAKQTALYDIPSALASSFVATNRSTKGSIDHLALLIDKKDPRVAAINVKSAKALAGAMSESEKKRALVLADIASVERTLEASKQAAGDKLTPKLQERKDALEAKLVNLTKDLETVENEGAARLDAFNAYMGPVLEETARSSAIVQEFASKVRKLGEERIGNRLKSTTDQIKDAGDFLDYAATNVGKALPYSVMGLLNPASMIAVEQGSIAEDIYSSVAEQQGLTVREVMDKGIDVKMMDDAVKSGVNAGALEVAGDIVTFVAPWLKLGLKPGAQMTKTALRGLLNKFGNASTRIVAAATAEGITENRQTKIELTSTLKALGYSKDEISEMITWDDLKEATFAGFVSSAGITTGLTGVKAIVDKAIDSRKGKIKITTKKLTEGQKAASALRAAKKEVPVVEEKAEEVVEPTTVKEEVVKPEVVEDVKEKSEVVQVEEKKPKPKPKKSIAQIIAKKPKIVTEKPISDISPALAKTKVSTLMLRSNRLSNTMATAKEKGQLDKEGVPKLSAPETVKAAFAEQKKLNIEIAKFRKLAKPIHVDIKAPKLDIEKAEVKQIGEPKKSKGVSETDFSFKTKDISGNVKVVSVKGQPDIFYANSGTRVSNGMDSAQEAINDLKKQKPKEVSQIGKGVISFTGQAPSKSVQDTVGSLSSSPKIVRTEIEPKKEGETVSKMKIFMEGGKFTTVGITSRGKTVSINKKTGKPDTTLDDELLKQHPDLIELINEPNKTKATTIDRLINTSPEVDHNVVDPIKFTEKGKDFAKQIRSKKIHVPKGALRASAGFEEVYNGALEIAATTMEAGGKFADALRAAMKHIRLSDWYKSLGKSEQAIREQMAEDEIVAAYNEAGIPLDDKRINKALEEEKAKLQKENKGIIKRSMQRVIFDRRAALSLSAYETRLFVEGINIQTTKLEREILPFIIEGTAVPESLRRPDLVEAYENRDKKKLSKIAKEIKRHNDKVWKQMIDGREDMDEKYKEDYITHMWDIPKNKNLDVTSHFTTNNKWANPRYIETLLEGIEKFDLKPKLLDISEILTMHGSMANNVTANKQMIEDLKNVRLNGKKVIVGNALKSIPSGWVTIDTPALKSFKIDPRVAEALAPIFATEWNQDAPLQQALEKGNSLVKGMQLTISLFHHGALIEAALPLLRGKAFEAVFKQSVGRGLLKAKSKINGNQSWAQLPYAFQNQEIARDALSHGVQLGASIDIRIKDIETMFKKITTASKKAGKLIGGKVGERVVGFLPSIAEGTIEANNALLWDYLHDTLKLMAYEKMVQKIPAEFAGDPEATRKYKIEQGQFVNDSFGGQNWDVLGFTPRNVQAARWWLLSPDWTVSTLRQAAPVVLGLPYLGASAAGATKTAARLGKAMGAQFESTAGVRAKTGLKFWGYSALIYGIMYNTINAFFRDQDMEEFPELYTKQELENPWARTMLGNTAGHYTHVFSGRYADGQERYLRVGKQFRELPELVLDDKPDISVSFPTPALKKIGGKASPLANILSVTLTGRSLSGFEIYDLKNKVGWDRTLALGKVWAKAMSPFSFNALFRDDKEFRISDLIFPSSKGMSITKGAKYLHHYMGKGDMETIALVLQHARRNDINIKKMGDLALARFNADMAEELAGDFKEQDEILNELKKGGLTERQIEVLTRKLQNLEKDKEQRLIGKELTLVVLEKYLELMEKAGKLNPDDFRILNKTGKELFE